MQTTNYATGFLKHPFTVSSSISWCLLENQAKHKPRATTQTCQTTLAPRAPHPAAWQTSFDHFCHFLLGMLFKGNQAHIIKQKAPPSHLPKTKGLRHPNKGRSNASRHALWHRVRCCQSVTGHKLTSSAAAGWKRSTEQHKLHFEPTAQCTYVATPSNATPSTRFSACYVTFDGE